MFSMTTAPPRQPPKEVPSDWMTGMMEFGSAWTKMTRRRESPLAVAVTT